MIFLINGRLIKSLSVTNKGFLIPKLLHAIDKSFALFSPTQTVVG